MIVALKFSILQIIFLLMIAFIHHSSADDDNEQKCENLLQSIGYWIHEGTDVGLQNFKTSFKNISIKKIQIDFGVYYGHMMSNEKKLQYALTMQYFKDLSKEHGFDFSKIIQTDTWCATKANEITENEQLIYTETEEQFDFENVKSKHYNCCMKIFSDSLSTNEDNLSDFQRMYKNWAIYPVGDEDHGILFTIRGFLTQDELFYFTACVLPYHKYVSGIVDELGPEEGTYESISEFCKNKGKDIVANRHGRV